jgi:hypothetical protein
VGENVDISYLTRRHTVQIVPNAIVFSRLSEIPSNFNLSLMHGRIAYDNFHTIAICLEKFMWTYRSASSFVTELKSVDMGGLAAKHLSLDILERLSTANPALLLRHGAVERGFQKKIRFKFSISRSKQIHMAVTNVETFQTIQILTSARLLAIRALCIFLHGRITL